MTTSTSNKDILLIIVAGDPFYKKFRWKNKYKEPIVLTGYDFKSQFRYNFGEDNIVADLTVENGGIIVNAITGEISIYIPYTITSILKSYDEGLWSIEYNTTLDQNFKTLIGGRWSVRSDITQ